MKNAPSAVALAALTMLLLAGCAGPIVGPTPDPATLQAPAWSVGDSWHYKDADGNWRNVTVEAIEDYAGHPTTTYRVLLSTSQPDEFGSRGGSAWFDNATLGIVAVRQGGFQARFEPPGGQLFPAINRTYTSVLTVSNGYSTTIQARTIVDEWETVRVPAGRFHAIEILTWDDAVDEQFNHVWYNPTVGNFVRLDEAEVRYDLVSWHRAEA